MELKDILDKLPPELQEEVRDFVEFLLGKKPQRKQKYLRLSWVGALKEYGDKFTALELQKKALEWWGLIYLVDTNVWLELLLEKERANETHQFLQKIEASLLIIQKQYPVNNAYRYCTALRHNYSLVSFNGGSDRTEEMIRKDCAGYLI